MRVENQADLSPKKLAEIQDELSWQENLNDVVQWALAEGSEAVIPGVVADVVVQDEFTHDVIVPWRDNLVLVYDTT